MTKGSHQLQLDSHSRKLFMEFVQLSRQRHFIHVRESHKCTFSNLKKCHQNQSCQEFLISCQSDKSLWKTWKKLVPLFYSFWRKTVNSKLMTMQKKIYDFIFNRNVFILWNSKLHFAFWRIGFWRCNIFSNCKKLLQLQKDATIVLTSTFFFTKCNLGCGHGFEISKIDG